MDFFIVGAAKSGTTILYEWLRQQNGIFMPEVKEPHYYCFRGALPRQIGKGVDPAYASDIAFSQSDYENLYAAAAPYQIRGDASPGYLYFPGTAAAIHTANPDAKIIIILRNPMDRAYSQYMHHRRDGFEPLATFAEALDAEKERIKDGWWWGYHYLAASRYSRPIERYTSLFPEENILILTYDDLAHYPEGVFQQIMQFLGCETDHPIDFGRSANVASSLSQVPRFSALHRIIEAGGPVHRTVQALLPHGLVRLLRNGITTINKTSADRMSEDMRSRLAVMFYPDILRVSHMTDLDLSNWFEAKEG